MTNYILIYRILIILLSSAILYTLLKIYLKTNHKNYGILVVAFMFLIVGSAYEILAVTASSEISAIHFYLYSAIGFTLTYATMMIYLSLTFDQTVKELSFLLIGGLISIELYETVNNPITVIFSDGSWLLENVRSQTAYLSRSIMMLIILLIFSIYLSGYIQRTKIKRRKILSILLVAISLISALTNAVYLYLQVSRGGIINQTVSSFFGFLFSIVLWLIILLDPYLFVFFRGKVNLILVYRDDGVLLTEITLRKKFDFNYSLIASFVSAISEFGKEIIFDKQSLNYIVFEKEKVFIVPFKNIYSAILGEDLTADIKGFVMEFLKAFYKEFSVYIKSGVLIIPDEEKVYELFIGSLGRVIL